MDYGATVRGRFLDRPNRFIAHVEVGGETVVCHVKNTGRCRELLIPGATVILAAALNPLRKTPYDLVAVYKGDRLINMDSQAPNDAVAEWLEKTDTFGRIDSVRREYTHGRSRFDFYLLAEGRPLLLEVKGVTLEQDGVVLFPDAPTERGTKHLRELTEVARQGHAAAVLFVVQMEDCLHFSPNRATDPAFADALAEAQAAGVRILAVRCHLTERTITIGGAVAVLL